VIAASAAAAANPRWQRGGAVRGELLRDEVLGVRGVADHRRT
jgi:hypothetical protein